MSRFKIQKSSFKIAPILCCLLSLTGLPVTAQSCLPTGISFESQTQIDAFAQLYPNCREIIGKVIIDDTNQGDITNLEGLSTLLSIGQSLEIRDNAALINLSGLDNLKTIGGGLHISFNLVLKDLSGLGNLTTISSSLLLAENENLENLKALQNISNIPKDLTIKNNPVLKDLNGLQAIIEVGGQLNIIGNESLNSLSRLSNLKSIGNEFHLLQNSRLNNPIGLWKLTHIGGDLIIDENNALNNLKGLDSLAIIDGFLQIVNNERLINLSGLDNLKVINGLLQIYNNPSLVELIGIDNIDPKTIIDLALLSSNKLINCSVKSVCDYLKMTSNMAAISQNGMGCNSRVQILPACPNENEGLNSMPPQNVDIQLYPNPTKDIVTIQGKNIEKITYRIYDSLGKLVREETSTGFFLDLSELVSGLFFVELICQDRIIVKPIIKLE